MADFPSDIPRIFYALFGEAISFQTFSNPEAEQAGSIARPGRLACNVTSESHRFRAVRAS